MFYEKVSKQIPTSTVTRDELPSTVHQCSTEIMPQSPADIIQEMLTNESDYVRQLTNGIRMYLNHENENITETIKGKIIKMFGNIQQIRDFHENTFYSYLSDCKDDVTKIANVFIKFTQVIDNYSLLDLNFKLKIYIFNI